jgi:CBS domain-containing protein
MKTQAIKDIIVPLSDYATVSQEATLMEAFKALESEKKRYGDEPYRHNSLLVLDGGGLVVGRVSQVDLMRALEPRYRDVGDMKTMGKMYLSDKLLVAIREELSLWEQPLKDLCSTVGTIQVKEFMQIPVEGEFVKETDTLNVALHRIVMGQHHSLLVTRGKEIVGILRSTDVFNRLCNMIKTCET